MDNYLAERRKELGLTQKEVSEIVGVAEATISRWESGAIANMRRDRINLYAKALKTTPAFIMTGESESDVPDGFIPMPDMASVPLVGRIACGEPITAEQNVEGVVSVPSQWRSDFALLCKGDSMEPSIKDGDLVAIHIQPMVENGEVAAVRIDSEATDRKSVV